MNNMNMPNMNHAAGGPVGGGVPMMHNATTSNPPESNESMKIRFNTYIYDYFLKHGFYESARALVRDEKFQISTTTNTKQSPGRQVNGVDDMDTDSKDDVRIPDDLPRPSLGGPDPSGNSFLFDWYCLFSDVFQAQRTKGKPGQPSAIRQYLWQAENLQRLRDSQNGQMLRGNPQMMASQMNQFNNMRIRNGAMTNAEMQKRMIQSNMTPQQMQQLATQNKLMQNMQRGEQADMEMNGQRPQSPSGENTGSPNKRPRLEGAQFNGQQMGPNGRGQGMAPNMGQNAMTNMMMKNGVNVQGMTPQQYQSFAAQNPAVQAKSIQGAMPNGMMNPAGVMPNQGSPMMQQMNENFILDPNFNNPAVSAQMRATMAQQAAANGGQGGNHALQDYQMQLMLLEQQNKKRLMMARQEQDSMTRADGQPGIPAQQGMQPPGMSPSGSRNGPSPNPNEQMKRTPQLGQSGIPGSPTPGGPTGSPAPMNFNGQMPQDFSNQMFAMGKLGEGMMPGQGVRPPNGMNPAMQASRMPANWQQGGPGGQPMMQQPSQQGQPQGNIGTPQQRNEMPPPQAPAAAGPNAGRGTQPSSPQTTAQAPPTPQQTSKGNPTGKGKKSEKGNAKNRPQKKNTANSAAANNAEASDPPATPTPSTPITPVHPNAFNKNAPSSGNASAGNTSAPTSAPQPNAATAGQQPQQGAAGQQPGGVAAGNAADPNHMGMAAASFGDFNGVDPSFNLDFGPLDAPDVLENFDFDSFLNNPDEGVGATGFSFDAAGLGLDGGYGVDNGAEV